MASAFVLTARVRVFVDTASLNKAADLVRKTFTKTPVVIPIIIDPKPLKDITKRLDEIGRGTKRARSGMAGLGAQIKKTAGQLMGLGLVTGVMIRLTMAFREGFKQAVEFDREMVKLTQITGRSRKALQPLVDQITNLSESFGVSSASLVTMTRILKQTGLSVKDTKLAMRALAMTDLSPTFSNMEKTAEGAIAAMRQFNIEAKDLHITLGAINAVSKQFAVESDDLITAIRRTGGVFSAAGGQINELIALFTSVRATTRETAETIATGLRTIFTRIQRPKTIKFLRQFGIELTDLQGQFVGPMEAIRRLSVALRGMETTDLTFGRIIEQLGGFRQVGKVIPMITQNEMAWRAYSVAVGGANSVARDAEKAQAALAIKFAKVKEEFMDMMRSIMTTDGFGLLVDGALKFASALIKITEALAKLAPALMGIAALKLGGMAGSAAVLAGAQMTGASTMSTGGMAMAGGGAMMAAAPWAAIVPAVIMLTGAFGEQLGMSKEVADDLQTFGGVLLVAGVAVTVFKASLGVMGGAITMVTGALIAYSVMMAARAKREAEAAIKRGSEAEAGQKARDATMWESATILSVVLGVLAAVATAVAVAFGAIPVAAAALIVAVVAAVGAIAGFNMDIGGSFVGQAMGMTGADEAEAEARMRALALNVASSFDRTMTRLEKNLKDGGSQKQAGKDLLAATKIVEDKIFEQSGGNVGGLSGPVADPNSEEFQAMSQRVTDSGARAATILSKLAVEGAKSGKQIDQIVKKNKQLIALHGRGAAAAGRLAAAQEFAAARLLRGAKKTEALKRAHTLLVEASMAEYDAKVRVEAQMRADFEQQQKLVAAQAANAKLFALHAILTQDLGMHTRALTVATIEATEAMKGIGAAASLGMGKVGSTKVKGSRGKLLGDISNVGDMGMFTDVVDDLTGSLGGLGADVKKHVVGAASAFEALPEMIIAQTDPNTGELLFGWKDAIKNALGGLGNVPQEVIDEVMDNMAGIEGKVTPEKIQKLLEESAAKFGPVMDKLKSMYKMQLEHLNRLNSAYDQQRKVLGHIAKSQKGLVSHFFNAMSVMKKHMGVETTLMDARMQFIGEQKAILGQGGMAGMAGNVQQIGNTLRATNVKIVKAEKDMENNIGDPAKAKAAAESLSELKNKSEAATKALKHAADRSNERAVLESQIAKAKKERESRKGLLESATFGTRKQNKALAKDLRVTQFAAAVGDMDRIPDKFKGAVLKTLDRFKDSVIPGSGGKTGQEVKNQLMARRAQKMGASPEQIKRILYKGREEEMLINELGKLFMAEHMAKMQLLQTEQAANQMLTNEIQKMHQDFVNRLAAVLVQINNLIGQPAAGGQPAQPGSRQTAQQQAAVTSAQAEKDDKKAKKKEKKKAERKRNRAKAAAGRGAAVSVEAQRQSQEAADEQVDRTEDYIAIGMGVAPAVIHWLVNRGGLDEIMSLFNTGGVVYAQEGFQARGTDTVPAMLTPGEFVVKKSSAQKIGYGNLHSMNAMADGGVVYLQGGGTSGGRMPGSRDSSLRKFLRTGEFGPGADQEDEHGVYQGEGLRPQSWVSGGGSLTPSGGEQSAISPLLRVLGLGRGKRGGYAQGEKSYSEIAGAGMTNAAKNFIPGGRQFLEAGYDGGGIDAQLDAAIRSGEITGMTPDQVKAESKRRQKEYREKPLLAPGLGMQHGGGLGFKPGETTADFLSQFTGEPKKLSEEEQDTEDFITSQANKRDERRTGNQKFLDQRGITDPDYSITMAKYNKQVLSESGRGLKGSVNKPVSEEEAQAAHTAKLRERLNAESPRIRPMGDDVGSRTPGIDAAMAANRRQRKLTENWDEVGGVYSARPASSGRKGVLERKSEKFRSSGEDIANLEHGPDDDYLKEIVRGEGEAYSGRQHSAADRRRAAAKLKQDAWLAKRKKEAATPEGKKKAAADSAQSTKLQAKWKEDSAARKTKLENRAVQAGFRPSPLASARDMSSAADQKKLAIQQRHARDQQQTMGGRRNRRQGGRAGRRLNRRQSSAAEKGKFDELRDRARGNRLDPKNSLYGAQAAVGQRGGGGGRRPTFVETATAAGGPLGPPRGTSGWGGIAGLESETLAPGGPFDFGQMGGGGGGQRPSGGMDLSGVQEQLQAAMEPVMAKFQGVNVAHTMGAMDMNVSGGDGIGDAIAAATIKKIIPMVEGIVRNMIGRTEQDGTGQMTVRA
jgi:TP901 family phage tail tape measure protein